MVGTKWIAGLRLEPAVRAGVHETGGDKRTVKSGVGVGCSVNASLLRGSTASGQWVILKVFAFSETR